MLLLFREIVKLTT